jgi:hypothetical protein
MVNNYINTNIFRIHNVKSTKQFLYGNTIAWINRLICLTQFTKFMKKNINDVFQTFLRNYQKAYMRKCKG